MSDIVERLRRYDWAAHREENCKTAHEAADEIVRLRAPPTEAEVEAALVAYCDLRIANVARNHAMRAALEAAAKVREGK